LSKHPIAFMSYVRLDDQHENGRLTQFRERLSSEVRMQTGESFEIFQDRNDIKWGQQWKERIDGALDTVTFLIPMITPGFFKSPACREELERFVKRQAHLGRNDLILPVYYVDSPVLNDESRRKRDSLAAVIAARQYADWRDLRFEPLTSPEVGKRLAGIAKQIVEALERDQTPSTPARAVAVAAGAGAPTDSQEGQAQASGTAPATEAKHGPAPRIEVPIKVVDALHRGDYSTLTEALIAAKPGTRILVRPGLYNEGVVIDKPVEIVGDGEKADIVFEVSGKNVILFKSSMGRVANLTLRQTGGGDWFCVNLPQGRLDLEDCDIAGQSRACVAIHEGADPRVRRNRIHDGKDSGVMVYANGRGTLEDNEIFGNTRAGVGISGGGNPTLRRNRIYGGKDDGVLVHTNGQGILEDNDIFGNAFAGVEIREGSNPTLRHNRIHGGNNTGVLVQKDGQGTLEANDIFGNASSGVVIKEGGNPSLRRNRIHDGKASGVYVHTNGQGILEDNEIFGNARAGVAIMGGGNPTLRRNRISENVYPGISVGPGGGGVFEGNDLRGNTRGAWQVDPSSESKIKRKGNLE